ncbi:predicted protein [Naegleria gruberi]|uniref:Predicted protein n=1 Tax=Naegleria gruberi TaxID=5762 RepID=D2UZI8_NAEGR|nr:uncharacterized protein NAEGRDRAFT_61953 [Naegleria gruberi]EFC50159.1 predicted protein [Naegleria gruberi]|eukprot:XP_002682903.1 predicted protein [Naegleria gruberi strain NEG-M]
MISSEELLATNASSNNNSITSVTMAAVSGSSESSSRKKKSSSNSSEKIVRNKKVECGFNMIFNCYTFPEPINASSANIEKIYQLVRERLKNEIVETGKLREENIIENAKNSKFAMETDVDQESFDTKILKHRKTIRYKITEELQSKLYYGVDEPHQSIFAYIFELHDPFKLHIYTTENMKGKKSRNIIKFDIYKKVKIASLITTFTLGLIILETNISSTSEKMATVHILNGTHVFDKMMDNEKKRRDPSYYEEERKKAKLERQASDSNFDDEEESVGEPVEEALLRETVKDLITSNKFTSVSLYLRDLLTSIASEQDVDKILSKIPEAEKKDFISLLSKVASNATLPLMNYSLDSSTATFTTASTISTNQQHQSSIATDMLDEMNDNPSGVNLLNNYFD